MYGKSTFQAWIKELNLENYFPESKLHIRLAMQSHYWTVQFHRYAFTECKAENCLKQTVIQPLNVWILEQVQQ